MHTQGPVTFSIDRVNPQPLRWFWPGMIPAGKLTVLAGDPGLGKSFVTLDLAARASAGGLWPGGETPDGPTGVVMLNAEDDPADTIRPRLEALGADLSRVVMLDCVREGGRFADFDLALHIDELRHAITETHGACGSVGLVVIDPVSAFVGATDSYNNAQVRSMLKPLAELAADTGVAVVLVTHLRKSAEGTAVHRAMGSLAFTAAARVVLMASKHPDDPELRILSCAKSNLAPDRQAFVYAIEEIDGQPVVRWLDRFTGSADELLAGGQAPGRRASPGMTAFLDEVGRMLEAGPVASGDIEGVAARHGVPLSSARSQSTKARVGARSVLRDGAWWWERG